MKKIEHYLYEPDNFKREQLVKAQLVLNSGYGMAISALVKNLTAYLEGIEDLDKLQTKVNAWKAAQEDGRPLDGQGNILYGEFNRKS